MAGMFDNRIVLEIQQANDIIELISEHVSLKKKGREWIGLCPFHDDHRPSMNVSSTKQIFKCFACGAGGDVFKFIQMRENLSFPQAIERLAERAGIEIKKFNTQHSKLKTDEVDPNKLARANAWAAKYFQKNLLDDKKGKDARQYLTQRQIKPESIKQWQIGLAVNSPDDLLKTAKGQNIPVKLLEQAGLVTGQSQDKFINRLMFTITDVTGRVVAFGGRTLDGNGAKYINSPTTALFDKSNTLYGLEQARHGIGLADTAIVMEGYTDCIMSQQFGFNNVVATLGTSFTAGHAKILRRFAKKVILVYDGDTAGIEAANRALDICLSQHIDIKIATVPDAKDPCDYLLLAGKEGFSRILDGAVDVLQFKWERLRQKFDSEDTIAGKKSAVEEYLESIAVGLQAGNVPALECGLRINQVAKIMGLDSRQINKDISDRIKRLARSSSRSTDIKSVQNMDFGSGLYAAAQREIMEVLLNEPSLVSQHQITMDIFTVPVLQQIAEVVFGMIENDGNISLRTILAAAASVELSNCIIELAQSGEVKGNYEIRLAKAMEVIERFNYKVEVGAAGVKNVRKLNPHCKGMI
jgi:DNA primase